jgi:hypothetical protein
MPSSLKLSACLFATASALDLKPATSLLERKKPAVASLMESAKSFLKNGATPDVVEFADATLEEVSSIVIPAIINESLSDQRFIDNLHSRFEEVRQQLASQNQEVFQLNAEEQTESGLHKACRDEEDVKCQGKRNCEMELYRKWTIWVTEEEDLKEIHTHISGHFCPPDANGTLHAFRVASVPWMQQYMAQKIVVDAAEADYDSHLPSCVTAHSELDHKSSVCNAHQTTLEQKACAHATKITEVLAAYYNDHAQALAAFNCAVEEIMQLERDRKREWITLQVVNCLLSRVHELNGRPCDSETGEVNEQIAFCEQGHYVDVCSEEDGEPRLCLNYPPIPTCPPECPARDQVIGVCLPVVQPIPCDGAWREQEYASLPEVPLPPFSATNPGCNAYPECNNCAPLATPAPVNIDSCPGYTVDGCIGSDDQAGEHPLTFIRDVDGVADVRCCAIDGDSCQSQGFEGGVDFVTPNGGTHTECYFDVTYQQAMEVCHNAGKRMCTTDEMQTCCNTGCWHNHHAIWVDVRNDQVAPQLD